MIMLIGPKILGVGHCAMPNTYIIDLGGAQSTNIVHQPHDGLRPHDTSPSHRSVQHMHVSLTVVARANIQCKLPLLEPLRIMIQSMSWR